MRTLALGLALALALGSAGLAQSGPAKPKYTLETPIHDLMEDPKMLAWLNRHFPGLAERMSDPEVGTLFAGVSIYGLSIDPDHGRALTPEVMAKLRVSMEKAQEEPGATPPPT